MVAMNLEIQNSLHFANPVSIVCLVIRAKLKPIWDVMVIRGHFANVHIVVAQMLCKFAALEIMIGILRQCCIYKCLCTVAFEKNLSIFIHSPGEGLVCLSVHVHNSKTITPIDFIWFTQGVYLWLGPPLRWSGCGCGLQN